MALISIVMPVKNAELYLDECVGSIRRQSYKNWELHAVDDGSTDGSYEKMVAASREDSRISIHRNSGSGILSALRLALEQSSGLLVTRMDADDIMGEQKLASLSEIVLGGGKKTVATAHVSYFATHRQLENGFKRYEEWLNHLARNQNHARDRYKECVLPSPCWMAFREEFGSIGGFTPDIYPEDYDLFFRFFKNGFKIRASQKILHFWRDHPTRASRTDPNYEDQRFFDIKLKNFFDLDFSCGEDLVLWGAGQKGKNLAKLFLAEKRTFTWVCNNTLKINKKIYDQSLFSFDQLKKLSHPKVVIAVAGHQDQIDIHEQAVQIGLKQAEDFHFFC